MPGTTGRRSVHELLWKAASWTSCSAGINSLPRASTTMSRDLPSVMTCAVAVNLAPKCLHTMGVPAARALKGTMARLLKHAGAAQDLCSTTLDLVMQTSSVPIAMLAATGAEVSSTHTPLQCLGCPQMRCHTALRQDTCESDTCKCTHPTATVSKCLPTVQVWPAYRSVRRMRTRVCPAQSAWSELQSV